MRCCIMGTGCFLFCQGSERLLNMCVNCIDACIDVDEFMIPVRRT